MDKKKTKAIIINSPSNPTGQVYSRKLLEEKGLKNIEKNGIKLNAAAHKLKGTLRYLAAERAVDAAYVLELAGKSNHMEGIEDKLEALNRECRKILAFINGFKG